MTIIFTCIVYSLGQNHSNIIKLILFPAFKNALRLRLLSASDCFVSLVPRNVNPRRLIEKAVINNRTNATREKSGFRNISLQQEFVDFLLDRTGKDKGVPNRYTGNNAKPAAMRFSVFFSEG